MGGKSKKERVFVKNAKRQIRKKDRDLTKQTLECLMKGNPEKSKKRIWYCRCCIGCYQDLDMTKQRSRKNRAKQRKQDRDNRDKQKYILTISNEPINRMDTISQTA